MDDGGQRPTTIGHLSVSGDLKSYHTIIVVVRGVSPNFNTFFVHFRIYNLNVYGCFMKWNLITWVGKIN